MLDCELRDKDLIQYTIKSLFPAGNAYLRSLNFLIVCLLFDSQSLLCNISYLVKKGYLKTIIEVRIILVAHVSLAPGCVAMIDDMYVMIAVTHCFENYTAVFLNVINVYVQEEEYIVYSLARRGYIATLRHLIAHPSLRLIIELVGFL